MNCPVCDKPMITLELDQVEVDHCLRCKGTWLDAGELELLLEGAENGDSLMASVEENVTTHEARRKCPICGKKMKKVTYSCGEGERVLVDRCTRNDGLWLDEGELSEIINMGDFPREHKICRLLSDVFGSHKQSDV